MRIAHDGSGGIFLAWNDARPDAMYGLLLHRLTGDGDAAPGWPVGGHPVNVGRDGPLLVSDEEGGVYLGSTHGQYGPVAVVRYSGDDVLASGWSGIVEIPGYYTNPLVAPPAPHAEPLEALGPWGAFLPSLALDPPHGVIVTWTHREPTFDHSHFTHLTPEGGTYPAWGLFGAKTGATWLMNPAAPCTDGAGGVFCAQQESAWTYMLVYHVNADFSVQAVARASADSSAQSAPGIVPDGAGGAYAFWSDHRLFESGQPYVQRVGPDLQPAAGWPASGLVLSPFACAPGSTARSLGATFALSSVTTDGAGGAYIAWTDYRAGATQGGIYAQHVLGDATIAPGWPADGLAVAAASGDRSKPVVAPDGSGGLLVAWQDARSGNQDIYAQRLNAVGQPAPGWPGGGVAVCSAEGDQLVPAVESDGAGGAFVAWEDRRGAVPQIYASHIAFDAAVPVLASLVQAAVRDGVVHLEWLSGAWRNPVGIERRGGDAGWAAVAAVLPQGDGRIVYDDRDAAPGLRYGYRLVLAGAAGEQRMGETYVDLPGGALTLDTPAPNPSPADPRVVFTLPDAGAASLELFDLAGRRVCAREVGSLGAGRHTLAPFGSLRLRAGVYRIRLTRAGTATTRALVVAP